MPSFSYPGGIWINDKCDSKCHKLLLEFIALTLNGRILFQVEKQQNGILIRFDDNETGLNCFDYIIDNLK